MRRFLPLIWFLLLPVIFGRAFNYFTDFDQSYHFWSAVCAGAAWIAALGVTIILRRRQWGTLVLCALLLVGAFFLQAVGIHTQGLQSASGESHALFLGATVAFNMGNTLYLLLWMRVLGRLRVTDTITCIAIGSVLGIAATDLFTFLASPTSQGILLCSIMRLAMVITSLIALAAALRDAAAPAPGVEKCTVETAAASTRGANARPNDPSASLSDFLSVAATAILLSFVLNASQFRGDEAAATGVWLLPLTAGIAFTIIVAVTRKARNTDFEPRLYDAFCVLSIVLYLVFVAVTGGLTDALWVIVYLANGIIDLSIIGQAAPLVVQGGRRNTVAVCLAFATREIAALAGVLSHHIMSQPLLNTLNLILLLLGLAALLSTLFLRFGRRRRAFAAGPADNARRYASRIGNACGCTPREEEILFYLLQGSSYARIAKKLVVSESTVKSHANHVYAKLGIAGRDELIDRFYAAEEADG